jgi:hypothetical protein
LPTYSARLHGSSTLISNLLGAFTPGVMCRTLFLMLRVKMCERLPPLAACCGNQAQLERYCSFNALSQNCKKATINFVLSVRPSVCLSSWNSSSPIGQIFMNCYISGFFETLSRKTPLHVYDNIFLSSSWNEKCFIQKL